MKAALLAAALGAALVGWPIYSTYGTVDYVTATVERSERVNEKYLIFTPDEVFENTDAWGFFKFNSSDVYGKAKPGAVCEFKVNGFRIPFFSYYRNIISATCQGN